LTSRREAFLKILLRARALKSLTCGGPVDTRDGVLKVAQALFAERGRRTATINGTSCRQRASLTLKSELSESPWEQNGVLAILRFS
jgi:hypothetical protein